MNNPKMKPALIGGAVFGVLATLPYIQYVNAVCCALYIGGGVLAVYLYLKEAPRAEKTPYGDGAVVGALAGLFGAVATTLATIVLRLLGVGEEDAAQALAALEQSGVELPQFVLDMMGTSGLSVGMVFSTFVMAIILYGIFATIGGLLGAAIFHRKEQN